MPNTQTTYLFYDTETTGINPCFDQIIQFAGIRTDLELNEIERYEIFIQLNPDVVPSPAASLTHRISLAQCANGISEYEAIRKIHRLFNTPDTISIGYNNLGFDDEFLRFAFFRNLLSPYTHQFQHNCMRMDLFPITVMYYLYKNEILTWPKNDEGKTSLKLENINNANQLASGPAHNALVDVEVTLALARRLYAEGEMWNYLKDSFDKKIDVSRMPNLNLAFTVSDIDYPEALLVNGKLGFARNFIAPVLGLGQHNYYKNQTLWLRLDLRELQTVQADNIHDATFVIRKRAGEAELLLPTNPRFIDKVSEERQNIAEDNKKWLQAHPELLQKIVDYHREFQYPEITNVDADAALYQIGFPNSQEESLMRQFHQADIQGKIEIATRFTHPVRRGLALRLLSRNFYNDIAASDRAEFDDYVLQIAKGKAPIDYRERQKLTPQLASTELHDLEAKADETQLDLLHELNDYLSTQFQHPSA